MDLFEENLKKDNKNQLLAARMRPAKLDDFVGKNVPTAHTERVRVRLTEMGGADEVVIEK